MSVRGVGSFAPTRRRGGGSNKSGVLSTATRGSTRCWHVLGFARRCLVPPPRRPIPKRKRPLEKGGLLEALLGVGLRSEREAWHSDEMRLGLRGQTGKVLAPKGVKVVQPVQLVYEWSCLVLAVSPLSGEIKWEWIERMRQEYIRAVLEGWALEAVVWDKAPPHRANSLAELGTIRVFLPSYSPELNPAERIFEEVRRRVEGKVYESLGEKREKAESYLKELAADPQRVKRACVGGDGCESHSSRCRRVPGTSDVRHYISESV